MLFNNLKIKVNLFIIFINKKYLTLSVNKKRNIFFVILDKLFHKILESYFFKSFNNFGNKY